MTFEIKEKVAFITGASSGLGYCIAKTLMNQGLKGVAIIDIDEAKGHSVEKELTKKYGENCCVFIKTDVSNELQVEDAFKRTVKTFKQLDIVINNAAVISEMDWKKCLDTNLGGCLLGTKLAIDTYLPQFKKGREGIILNISSIVGLQPLGVTPIYSVTKQGIVALGRTYGMKEHYEKTKIKVLTICPGHMKTPMVVKPKFGNFNLKYLLRFSISLKDFPMQEPEFVAESLSNIMKTGQSGSVWVVEGGEAAYEVEFKNRLSMRKK